MENLPLGTSNLAGSPGMMRKRKKLNEATRMMVKNALATFG